MNSKVQLETLEVYITNVCNLTCSNCNRYNNYKFTGWQNWADYESTVAQWAEYIDVKTLMILGGEPLLNPTIVDWIRGLRKYWPNAFIGVQSNGTRIDHVPGLYEALLEKSYIMVSVHDPQDLDPLTEKIQNFLRKPLTRRDKVNSDGSENYFDIRYTDVNNCHVDVLFDTKFTNSSVIQRADGTFTLHQNKPEDAHRDCCFHKWKNYHMIWGKIYKCGPVALMPEFDQQYALDISDEDRTLLKSYQPLTIDMAHQGQTQDFFNGIDNAIPQCKFCPTDTTASPITFTDLKKPWRQLPKSLVNT